MKPASLSRRNQTAFFAVTPAQGNGEGSITVTLTVLPISKSLTLPRVTQFSGGLRNSGAIIKPTSGIPTTAAQKPARAIESFSKKRRRLISSGASTGTKESSAMFSFMTNFCYPSSERCGEEDKTNNENDPRSDQAPKEKSSSHRQPCREISGMRQRLRQQRFPIRMWIRYFVRHEISPGSWRDPTASERAGPELPQDRSNTSEPTSAGRPLAGPYHSLAPIGRG